MVNNIKKIREMISFEDEFDFYFLQILKRRKDNPDLKRDMVVIANYHIDSFEQYDSLMPHIINLCDAENARAYFRVNRRNYKHLSYHMLKRVVDVIASGMVKSLKGSFDSVTGQYHSDKDKKWVVDADADVVGGFEDIGDDVFDDRHNPREVQRVIHDLQKETKKDPLIYILPTKNGFHFITRPFNLKKFKERYPDITVHKDNPTILYCP